jgi:hypothetical protein
MIYIISLLTAVIWHSFLRRLWLAIIGSTMTSSLLSWLLLMSHFGWLDRIFFINLLMTVSIALAISIFVGLIFSIARGNIDKSNTRTNGDT